ncbi:MAG: hypothetical protein H6707_08810 [Deltaproteobacteria bacterium]|nr:hypothetical protein [Deltaproteobacteria bacterium]
MSAKRILITGCGGPIGVNITRSLLAADEPLFLAGTDCHPLHLHLALCDRSWQIPPAKQTEPYFAALNQLIAEQRIEMILPTHPVEVRALSANRHRLPPDLRLFLPTDQTIHRAQDKWQTNQLLDRAGVPVPLTLLMEKPDDVDACYRRIDTRPIWVRGSGVPGAGIGVASLPCKNAGQARAWIEHHDGWGQMISSEYLPGRNLTWCGLFSDGTLVASQSRERLAYVLPHVSPSGITGAPAISRTIREPRLREIGEAAVRAIDDRPNGVFFVDFKEDDQQQAKVTEINAGRFGTTIHFYTEAGCNFVQLLVKLAFGETIDGAPLHDPLPPNIHWLRTLDCGPVLLRPRPEQPA